ncbi:oxidoreductase [Corynebacterium rouxii]|uniref:Oxidoreductase n=1 Tax=Corynebacterium rouxii TaxID=2719119 RepID=A0ABU3PNQ2_9CORY|nr:oxidoreductase [Corynebacterium rouxii]MDT9409220.1 oxidoreductase [Corynebacterium rouxii]MDT9411453.1 oxidoreductase [Corynebacterium rouxii]
MFNLFGRKAPRSNIKPARGPGETVREADLRYLQEWVSTHAVVEAFVEPETIVNEMSVVLVDITGEFTRRRIGGPKGIDVISSTLGVPVYDVEETGYPQRMREKIERDRILRKREEQRERREKLQRERERGESQ